MQRLLLFFIWDVGEVGGMLINLLYRQIILGTHEVLGIFVCFSNMY